MLDLLPYGTKTVRVLITGAELKKQLEIAASSLIGVNDHYEPSLRCYNGEFLQMSGLKVVYDTTKTPAQVVARRMTKPGARVASLLIDGSGGWTPVEDDKVYSVGTSEFAVKEWNCLLCEKTGETDMHAFDAYLEKVLHRRAAPVAEGRITIIR
jgi:5'-nucleotidase/UDP-sugar diphosphatase